MTDNLNRDVPAGVPAAIDLTTVTDGASQAAISVSAADLHRFARTFADLDSHDVMSQAWR